MSVPQSYYRTIDKKMAEELFNDITRKKVNSLYLSDNIILVEGAMVLVECLKSSSVTQLTCRRNAIEDGAMQVLSTGLKHTRITHLELDFRFESIKKESQMALVTGLCHTSITYCKINMKFEQGFIEALAQCLQDTKIQTLDLSECNTGDLGLKILAPNLKKSRITNLRLCWNNIGDKGIKILAENLKECQLEELDLFGNEIGEKGAEVLSEHLTTSSITNLGVQRNGITDTGIKSLVRGAEKSKITSLNISSNGMYSSKSAKAVANCLKKDQILLLDVGGMNLHARVISVLFGSLQHSQLTHLSLGYNGCKFSTVKRNKFVCYHCIAKGLKDKDVIELASGLKNSNVTHLDLSGNKIGIEGAKALARGLKFTKITHLYLGKNQITNQGAKALAEGLKFTDVSFLDLSENEISDEAAAVLMESLRNTKVTHFDFSHNLMCDKGIKALGENIHKTRLQRLDLSSNKIQDDSAAVFVSKLKGPEITYLSLESNEIGDAALKALAGNLKYTRITALDLGHNSFSEEGITALAEGLKGTHLTYLNLNLSKTGTKTVRMLGRCIKDTCVVHLVLRTIKMDTDTVNYLSDCFANTQLFDLVVSDQHTRRLFQESAFDDYEIDGAFFDFNRANLTLSACIRLRNTMFDNWKNAQYFVQLFKSLVSKESNSLEFAKVDEEEDVEEYINKCISLLIIVKDNPGRVAHIILDKDFKHMPEDIKFFFADIINKFCMFVACRLEAKVGDYVSVLKKCEQLQLNDVVANLLLHRTLYTIETEKHILHPYAYNLLQKYNQVIYQESLEPQKRNIIMDYFKQHPEIEGAQTISDLFS